MAGKSVQGARPNGSESVAVVGREWERRKRGPPRRPLADRLWERVEKGDGCWLWTGLRNGDGYGSISRGGHCGRMVGAHVAAWEVTHGPVPEGLEVCHRCDVRNCVRPDHLFLGTHSENMLDAAAKGRLTSRPPVRHGEANGRALLSAEAVADIRARYKVTATAAQLAAEHGVSRGTIYAVGQGRIWRQAA